jgi:hypothetical protein
MKTDFYQVNGGILTRFQGVTSGLVKKLGGMIP